MSTTKIDENDILRNENYVLKLNAVKAQFDQLRKELDTFHASLVEKYEIKPEDQVDLAKGEIHRAEATDAA